MATVSIIIPVYNVEKYLTECLSSVTNQTYRDFEVLLIDDGSTDNCRDICVNWCHKDNRFNYYYKENGGLGSARNYGVSKAKGLWLTFLDSDDWWEPIYLEKMISKTQNKKINAIYCDTYVCIQGCVKKATHVRSMLKYIQADTRDRIALGIHASACGALYKKQIWDEIGIEFPHIIFEDTGIYGVLVHYFSSYDIVEMPLYNYRKRDGSIMDINKYEYRKMIVALDCLLTLARKHQLFETYLYEYFELCRSQLYSRWKGFKGNREPVKKQMIEFYQRNFYFYDKIGRIMSIGSPISAKVCEGIAAFPNIERDIYSFTSIVSMVREPLDDEFKLNYTGENEYRMRMIQKDIEKTWVRYRDKCQYIILDLLEERNDFIAYRDCLFTLSEAIDSECDIPSDVKIVHRDSEISNERWEGACDKFFEIVKQNNAKVILLELYLCERYGDFLNQNNYNNIAEIQSTNKRLNYYYDYVKNHYDVTLVKLDSEYTYTDREYKFGCYPWYFNECAIYILRKKTREIISLLHKSKEDGEG